MERLSNDNIIELTIKLIKSIGFEDFKEQEYATFAYSIGDFSYNRPTIQFYVEFTTPFSIEQLIYSGESFNRWITKKITDLQKGRVRAIRYIALNKITPRSTRFCFDGRDYVIKNNVTNGWTNPVYNDKTDFGNAIVYRLNKKESKNFSDKTIKMIEILEDAVGGTII